LNDKKELKLILVAARNQLSSSDIKSLIAYLESDDCDFEISLQISDPIESYFECITSCEITDGRCISRCVEILKRNDN